MPPARMCSRTGPPHCGALCWQQHLWRFCSGDHACLASCLALWCSLCTYLLWKHWFSHNPHQNPQPPGGRGGGGLGSGPCVLGVELEVGDVYVISAQLPVL